MREDQQASLPEGATEAREIFEALRRLSGSVFYLLSLAGGIFTIVAASYILRLFDVPPSKLALAEQEAISAKAFLASANQFGHDLKRLAAAQDAASNLLVTQMASGEPAHDVRLALDGTPNGLRTTHNAYLGVIDDLEALLQERTDIDIASRNALMGSIQLVAKISEENFRCLETLDRAYQPAESLLRGVRCDADGFAFNVRDRLKKVDSCETGIGRHLRSIARRLDSDASDRVEYERARWLFFWRAWLEPDTVDPSRAGYADALIGDLKKWCPGRLLPSDKWKASSGRDGGLYPPTADSSPTPVSSDAASPNSTAPSTLPEEPQPQKKRSIWDWLFNREPADKGDGTGTK